MESPIKKWTSKEKPLKKYNPKPLYETPEKNPGGNPYI
jgi:hypothetical protein